ncbi:NACHT, LRR and PYD domains-containing protein 3-like [Discoglossus pictus]
MKTPGDILCYQLLNLTQSDFKRFKHKLTDFCFGGKYPIPRGRLEKADPIDVKKLLSDVYGNEAVEVTIQVLQDIGLVGSAEDLQHEISKCTETKQVTNVEEDRMKTPDDILYYRLCYLSEIDFRRFKDKLSDFHFNAISPISPETLENADHIVVKNLLKEVYGDKVMEATVHVLQDVDLGGIAEKLQQEISIFKKTYGTQNVKEVTHLEDCRKKYMEYTIKKYKRMEEKNAIRGQYFHFEKKYTRLLLSKSSIDEEEEKKDEIIFMGVQHDNTMKQKACDGNSEISIQTLFDPDPNGNIPEIVLLLGPAGIGKTMTIHKILLDWATGKLYQDKYNFVFCISCRELNNITGEMSIADIISKVCQLKCSDMTLMKSILGNAKKILFIIDGLDESKWLLQATTHICYDEFEKTSMEILLNSLITKTCLSEASLLITTRPFTLGKLRKSVHYPRYVDVLGFTENNRLKYFYNFFEIKEQADMALRAVLDNETLFALCSVPITCWILCTVMKLQMDKGLSGVHFKTTTLVYMLFVKSLLIYHRSDCTQSVLKPVKKLCALARDGIWENKSLFEEEDLKYHGLTEPEIQSLFLNENVFYRDVECYTCFSFIHLSIQEFFAALYYALLDLESTDASEDSLRQEVANLKEKSKMSPQLTSTLSFLFGFFTSEMEYQIHKIFKWKISDATKSILEEWLKKKISEQVKVHIPDVMYSYYNTEDMNDFFRLNCQDIKGNIVVYGAISSCLINSPMNNNSICFHICDIDGKSLELLIPGFTKCVKIHLYNCGLTSACCEDLCSVLTTLMSLISLNLGDNSLKDTGVKYLCNSLKHDDCKLQDLNLYKCCLTSACCEDLCSVITTSTSLIALNLGYNNLNDTGVKYLCEALSQDSCKLQKLR